MDNSLLYCIKCYQVLSPKSTTIKARDHLSSLIMEESLILSEFDNLVKSGLVQYDDKQEIIEYIEGELKVSLAWTYAHHTLNKLVLTTLP